MMRSLYSGVSGLKVHQTKMDVIGNNIANVNTVAYKSNSVTFSEVFYQTTQNASGPNAETGKGGQNAMQIGLGTTVGSISTNIETEGASQRTDNPFDLKLSGNSFFVVNNAGANYFTRAGNFTVDGAGNLVTAGGNTVMGWKADSDGNIVRDTVKALSVKGPEYTYTTPEATRNNTVSGNINKEDSSFANGNPVVFNTKFYDSLGYSYLATIEVNQNPDEPMNYTLSVGDISCEGVKVEGYTIDLDNTDLTFDESTGEPSLKSFVMTIEVPDGATPIEPITVDISKLTSYGDATNIVVSTGDANGLGAGKAVGTMTGVAISSDGKIVSYYSNGDERTLGQIVVATFANPAALEKVGDNLYQATLNSGSFDGIGEDVTEGGGSISQGVLEMSNVDLSSEFTEMITTQRGFQANSRIITVSDTLLEELIQLKR
ncbi:MAG: flagellar hook protein FlgE [Lachnospira sp.]|nr:flagellar hook protein FlgE [Lachnospira sp.]